MAEAARMLSLADQQVRRTTRPAHAARGGWQSLGNLRGVNGQDLVALAAPCTGLELR